MEQDKQTAAWKFDKRHCRWERIAADGTPGTVYTENEIEEDCITFITFNVWFSTTYHYDLRNRGICRLLEPIRATVICLQEVRPALLRLLKAQQWVQDHYYISDGSDESVTLGGEEHYGVVILSRLAPSSLSFFSLPSGMGRNTFLVARFHLRTKERDALSLRVGTMHLDSKKSEPMRAKQLEKILHYVNEEGRTDLDLLLADFNICSSWEENKESLERYFPRSDWTDLWDALVPHRTVDAIVQEDERQWWWSMNPSRNDNLADKVHEPPARFDRILIRRNHALNDIQQSIKLEMIGTQPIPSEPSSASPQQRVWPSDHFGLQARVSIPERREAAKKLSNL